LSIGYLPQEALLTGTHTLWEECLNALSELRELEVELAQLESAMGDPEQAEAALERYAKLQPEFEQRGGYTYETRIRQTLTGLGFESGDFNRPLPQLSGGQRTRAVLARLLLSSPELLVLDEPTNHLDIPSQEILQEVLQDYEGTILLVSHDRYLIDALGSQIWEIVPDASALQVFLGTYSEYKAYLDAQKAEAEALMKQVGMTPKSSRLPVDPEERRRKARLREVEGLVAAMEATLHELGLRLETPPADPAKVQKLGEEYMRVQRELDRLLEEWGELQPS
jgi:ATP-binding cassette subfamily F protein 3